MRTRVLIIEDSRAQAAVIADVVRQAGHTPVVYHDVATGIQQILSKEQPDLVLLDLNLLDAQGKPIADGFQVCREIKKSPRTVPVVVISSEGDDEAIEWALLQGADAFLHKPFVVDDLTIVMSQVLTP